jgi:hypothetical protein
MNTESPSKSFRAPAHVKQDEEAMEPVADIPTKHQAAWKPSVMGHRAGGTPDGLQVHSQAGSEHRRSVSNPQAIRAALKPLVGRKPSLDRDLSEDDVSAEEMDTADDPQRIFRQLPDAWAVWGVPTAAPAKPTAGDAKQGQATRQSAAEAQLPAAGPKHHEETPQKPAPEPVRKEEKVPEPVRKEEDVDEVRGAPAQGAWDKPPAKRRFADIGDDEDDKEPSNASSEKQEDKAAAKLRDDESDDADDDDQSDDDDKKSDKHLTVRSDAREVEQPQKIAMPSPKRTDSEPQDRPEERPRREERHVVKKRSERHREGKPNKAHDQTKPTDKVVPAPREQRQAEPTAPAPKAKEPVPQPIQKPSPEAPQATKIPQPATTVTPPAESAVDPSRQASVKPQDPAPKAPLPAKNPTADSTPEPSSPKPEQHGKKEDEPAWLKVLDTATEAWSKAAEEQAKQEQQKQAGGAEDPHKATFKVEWPNAIKVKAPQPSKPAGPGSAGSKAEAQPSKPQGPVDPKSIKQEDAPLKDDWASTLAFVMEWLKTKEPSAAPTQPAAPAQPTTPAQKPVDQPKQQQKPAEKQPKQQQKPVAAPVPEPHHQGNSSMNGVIGSVKSIFQSIRGKPQQHQHQHQHQTKTQAQAHGSHVKHSKKASKAE